MAWKRNRSVIVAAMAGWLVGACDNAVMYQGDGKLIDNGILAAKDRYVLDLGALPLSRDTSRSYEIGNLPAESFVVGLELAGAKNVSLDSRRLNPVVAVELRDGGGKVLMRRKSPLNEWTWSVPSTNEWAFIYGKETFFKPAPGSSFRLSVQVTNADPAAEPYNARLVAKAGGWK
jgi:hypothetical protein